MYIYIVRAPRKSIRTCYIPDASALFLQLPVVRAPACNRMGDMAPLRPPMDAPPAPAKTATSAAAKAAAAAAKAAAAVAKAEQAASAAKAAQAARAASALGGPVELFRSGDHEGLHVEWDSRAKAPSSVSSAASARDQRSRSPRAYRITITTKPNGETKTEMTMVERN